MHTDRQLIVSATISVLLLAVFLAAFARVDWSYVGVTIISTAALSKQMFSPSGYGIALLVVAVLLAASMIGGVYLAKEE